MDGTFAVGILQTLQDLNQDFNVFFLRYLARTVADAMNPPVPDIQALAPVEEEAAEVPEPVRRSNELLERVEMMTREEPLNISTIIRQWINEPLVKRAQAKGSGK